MPSIRNRLVVVCICMVIFVDCFFGVLGVCDFPFGVCGGCGFCDSCGFLSGVCMSCALPGAGSTAASTELVTYPSRSLNIGLAGCFPFAT